MKKCFTKIAAILCIILYLIVPFKNQFLNGLHILSHISLNQDHHHHHNHYFNDHDHHHGWLAGINITLENHDASNALPDNLTNYKFEPPFPSKIIPLERQKVTKLAEKFSEIIIPILTGPFFDVPTPPP